MVELPEQEVQTGDLHPSQTYRVAILLPPNPNEGDESGPKSQSSETPKRPPVEEGERRKVEIEDFGDQGDGITRVERGFVVIVPDSDPEERVIVEITDVQTNVAFAEGVEQFHSDD